MCLYPICLSTVDTEMVESIIESSESFFGDAVTSPVVSEYVKAFGMGFALATLLILATYGVFKALSLLHI